MGKLSDEDKATLARLQKLQEEPDQDDDDDYVWVRYDDGSTVRLHGERARSFCRRKGIDMDSAEDSTKSSPVDAAAGGTAGQTPAKKAAPKKAAAAGAAGEQEAGAVDGAENLEQDASAKGRPRQFF
jgi:hypothetical protein